MPDDLEKQKWEFAKALFSIVMAQGILIAGLTKMQEHQWGMLRLIGKETGLRLPRTAADSGRRSDGKNARRRSRTQPDVRLRRTRHAGELKTKKKKKTVPDVQ